MDNVRKSVIIGLLVSAGLVLHIIEGMIPMAAVVPGAKLGLANVVNLIGLVLFGFNAGLQILILRILLGSFLIGSFMTFNFFLSLSGGLLGYLVMSYVYHNYRGKFSLIGISILGAVFHNIGQIIIAYFIIANTGIFYYLPFLLLVSIPTGIGVGLVTLFSVNYLPNRK